MFVNIELFILNLRKANFVRVQYMYIICIYIYIIYIYNYVVDVNAIFIVFSVISVVVVVRIAFYFVKFLLLDLPVLHFPH